MNTTQKIIEVLQGLRADAGDIDALGTLMTDLVFLKGVLSSRAFLALKRGDLSKVFLECFKACDACSSFLPERKFDSVSEFDHYFDMASVAVKKNKFVVISEPRWIREELGFVGAKMYFRCVVCSSVWCLTAPERESRGSWHRIG